MLEGDNEHGRTQTAVSEALRAFSRLRRLLDPVVHRNLSPSLLSAYNLSCLKVFEGLTRSREWLELMPQRASDGTSVWVDEPPAVTNEVEHGLDEVAAEATRGDGASRAGEEHHPEREDARTQRWQVIIQRPTPEEARKTLRAMEQRKREARASASRRFRRWPRRK